MHNLPKLLNRKYWNKICWDCVSYTTLLVVKKVGFVLWHSFCKYLNKHIKYLLLKNRKTSNELKAHAYHEKTFICKRQKRSIFIDE